MKISGAVQKYPLKTISCWVVSDGLSIASGVIMKI